MGGQKVIKGRAVLHGNQGSGLKIRHQDNRQHDLVGRKSQEKGHEDDAVQAKKSSRRIQKTRQKGKQACAADGNIRQQPDEKPGGGGGGNGPAKAK